MPLENDVMNVEKQLRKVLNDNGDDIAATDLLSHFKGFSVTKELLQKTNIYKLVSSLRKITTNENVRTLSKNLLMSWKKVLNAGDKRDEDDEHIVVSSEPLCTESALDSRAHDGSDKKDFISTGNNIESTCELTLDPVRIKCREMLSKALECDLTPSLQSTTSLGEFIETAIYSMFNNTGPKYKNHIKSRILNLKDKRNDKLRQSLLNGTLTAHQLAHMKTEDLACDDLRRERECHAEESLKEHQLPVDSTSNTGKYRCNKCGSTDTLYSQVQVGMKDDESLMTFVSCNKCGRKWKGEHLEFDSADAEDFEVT